MGRERRRFVPPQFLSLRPCLPCLADPLLPLPILDRRRRGKRVRKITLTRRCCRLLLGHIYSRELDCSEHVTDATGKQQVLQKGHVRADHGRHSGHALRLPARLRESIRERVDRVIRAGLAQLIRREVIGADADALDAGGVGALDVVRCIADHERLIRSHLFAVDE